MGPWLKKLFGSHEEEASRSAGEAEAAPVPPSIDGEELTVVMGVGDATESKPLLGDDEPTTYCERPAVTLERQRTLESYRLRLPCVVGKGTAADCRIGGNTTISRQHARIFFEQTDSSYARVLIEDLGSLNKTKVKGQDLAPHQPVELEDGTMISLSDETFVVRIA